MIPIAFPARWFAVLFLLVSALPLGAAEPAHRRQLLQLNNITGTDVIQAKIDALIKGGDKTRELLKLASTLANETDQPFGHNALYILARAAHELKEIETAEQFYRLAVTEALKLQSGQEAGQMLGGLIDLYFENHKYDETASVCQELLGIQGSESIDRLKPIVVERMIEALALEGKVNQAMKLADKLVAAEEQTGGWWFLRIKGDLLRQTERIEDAAKTYEVVLERLGKDKSLDEQTKPELVRQVRYVLSGAYTELNQLDRAVEQLQILLKEKPNDPAYNNDLGYLWADHDRNLDEAEKLIRKALKEARKQRKASAAAPPVDKQAVGDYLDSLGWVLFKQARYAEAKRYLLRAIKDTEKPEVEILDHLGDVHLALGERDEARKAYQQAVEAAGSSARDERRKEEVEEKLLMLGD